MTWQRILELSNKVRGGYDTGSLRAVYARGSALPGPTPQAAPDGS